MRSTTRGLVWLTAIVVLLVAGGWECTAAPKNQCKDGSTKVEVRKGHSTRYRCHNGEWSKE